jgi:hypothetical protein
MPASSHSNQLRARIRQQVWSQLHSDQLQISDQLQVRNQPRTWEQVRTPSASQEATASEGPRIASASSEGPVAGMGLAALGPDASEDLAAGWCPTRSVYELASGPLDRPCHHDLAFTADSAFTACSTFSAGSSCTSGSALAGGSAFAAGSILASGSFSQQAPSLQPALLWQQTPPSRRMPADTASAATMQTKEPWPRFHSQLPTPNSPKNK